MNLRTDADYELRSRFETKCQLMPDFKSEGSRVFIAADFSRNEAGDYIDPNVDAVWMGFKSAEEQARSDNTLADKDTEVTAPLKGTCECFKCKAMQFHKESGIHVCLACRKQVEPFLPVDFSDPSCWLPDC